VPVPSGLILLPYWIAQQLLSDQGPLAGITIVNVFGLPANIHNTCKVKKAGQGTSMAVDLTVALLLLRSLDFGDG
jgi:hypothetical protein